MNRPRFSLLLPTCNRLALLRQAIDSVRGQTFADFEIVIADNASEEDVAGYVRALGDPRIVYGRSDERLDVTANWNRALALSSGELVLMLGDDDGLARGYLSRLDRLARETDPDAVYTGAWLLTYPGVNDHVPNGQLLPYGYAEFMRSGPETRALPYAERRQHALTMLSGRVSFGFNMQFLLVARRLIERLAPLGPFYQSLFPDYYATIACFLEAERLISFRRNCVFIGVSPKSYGFFHQRERESEGAQFLHTKLEERVPDDWLPGSHIVTGWQHAAEAIMDRLSAKHDLTLPRYRYRLRQIAHSAAAWHDRGAPLAAEVARRLTTPERLLWQALVAPVVGRRINNKFQRLLHITPLDWNPRPVAARVASLDEARTMPSTFVE